MSNDMTPEELASEMRCTVTDTCLCWRCESARQLESQASKIAALEKQLDVCADEALEESKKIDALLARVDELEEQLRIERSHTDSAIISGASPPTEAPRRAEDFEWWGKVAYPDGMTAEQIQNELADYHFLMEQVPKVYMAVTGDKLSKPNYTASTVISEFESHVQDLVDEAIKDDREERAPPPPSELRPAEKAALMVAWSQVQRGEFPMPACATVCVAALARIIYSPPPVKPVAAPPPHAPRACNHDELYMVNADGTCLLCGEDVNAADESVAAPLPETNDLSKYLMDKVRHVTAFDTKIIEIPVGRARQIASALDAPPPNDDLVKRLHNARLDWALMCPCRCASCDDLDEKIRAVVNAQPSAEYQQCSTCKTPSACTAHQCCIGLNKSLDAYCTCPASYPTHCGHHPDCNSQRVQVETRAVCEHGNGPTCKQCIPDGEHLALGRGEKDV